MKQIAEADSGEMAPGPAHSPSRRYLAGSDWDKKHVCRIWAIDVNTGRFLLKRSVGAPKGDKWYSVGRLKWIGEKRLKADICPPDGPGRTVTYRTR
jgi:hypothetical protein